MPNLIATVENMKQEMKDMVNIKVDLAQTHTVVEGVKKELANVTATVENMKKDSCMINDSV